MNILKKEGCIKELDQETSDIMIDRMAALAFLYNEALESEIEHAPLYQKQFYSLLGSWLTTGTASELLSLSSDERGVFVGLSASPSPDESKPSFNSIIYIYRPDYIENLVVAYLKGLAFSSPNSDQYVGNKAPVPIFLSILDKGYGAMVGVLLGDNRYDKEEAVRSIFIASHSFENFLLPSLPEECAKYFNTERE